MIIDELSVLWKVTRLHTESSMVDVQRADNRMRSSRIDLNDLQQVYRPKRMVTHHDPHVGGAWVGALQRATVRNDHVPEGGKEGSSVRIVRSLNQANHTGVDCEYNYRCQLTVSGMPQSNRKVWIGTFVFPDVHHPMIVPMVVRPFERTCVLFGRAVAGDMRITVELSSIDEDTIHLSCWMVHENGTQTHAIDGELHRQAGA
jgi:hypothetical protein